MNPSYIRRKIVQLRFFLTRANGWLNTPMMIIVFLGVIAPYLRQYIDFSLWLAFPLVTIGMLFFGYFEYRLGFPKTEFSFGQEQNTNLNSQIQMLSIKLDEAIVKMEAKK